MAGDTVITIVGNLTADPELRFTPSGAAVSNFTVASTPRKYDRQSNEWKDEETIFMRCSVWRDQAEHVANSLRRGMRVIVQGRLKSRSYQTKEGENRTSMEMDVEEVGASLSNAEVQVRKVERSGQQQGGWGQQPPGGSSGGHQPADDPWATNYRPAQPQQQQQSPQQQQQPPQPPPGWGQPQQQQPPPGWAQPPQQPPQQGGWGQPAQGDDRPPF